KEIDVMIVGRGGGSLEDLWAFNTEGVARAIAASHIPVVSAVGHETDFTISDFVADLRAPTPSAAAELTVPVFEDLEAMLRERSGQLYKIILRLLQDKRGQLQYFSSHLKHPRQRLQEFAQHIDLLTERLRLSMTGRLGDHRAHWKFLAGKLDALSPLAILKRGYSIAHILKADGSLGPILKEAKQAKTGDALQLSLHKGEIRARVEKR
ncbi:MAG: exodeoxyribonuclease VII large subunit, partial [bacterium]|nr:exodeoxyribonuclease VII large subunit [bacterium]